MRLVAKMLVASLVVLAGAASAAEYVGSAAALAGQMREAQRSEGFEARMNVLVTRADGSHPEPFKLAVVGQFAGDTQRLQIRGISPAGVRRHSFLVQHRENGSVSAMQSRAGGKDDYLKFDPYARIYGCGIVPWDMMGTWWSWPKQVLGGKQTLAGHECTLINSFAEAQDGAVSEVESCVDLRAKLALKTRIFGRNHVLLRTTTVQQMVAKSDGEAMMAKRLEIVDAANTRTALEIYAGDEEYQVAAQTFAPLDRSSNKQSQEKE